MKSWRSILSLLLLSVYALLLLHDFIPHTHHNHQADVHIISTAHHSHGDHHDHHHHEHHEEEGKDDKSPESSNNNSFGDHLIHTHSHSGYDAHQHDLAYRAAAKGKLISPVDAGQHLLADTWKFTDLLDDIIYRQFGSLPPPSEPHLSSGHGLRAPPALG